MKKVRVGVIGGRRGTSMISYCKWAGNAELVAICDNWKEVLDEQKERCKGMDVAFYDDYDEFLKHDMDAVILANYATEHAPFAIKALKAGKHVCAEVLPCQTMKEAVELVEAVEESGLIYGYAENYCYMPAPYEMKRLYQQGVLGEFEYGECEYIHNCETIWGSITYGDKNHWRNSLYSTFYCTHSLGPIIHMTGLRPVSVVGFEGTKTERKLRVGGRGGAFGIEMVTLENGGIIKSIHGGLYKNSVWYSVYGSKGRMESAREDSLLDTAENANAAVNHIYVNCDKYSGEYKKDKRPETYFPEREFEEQAQTMGHSGSDFYCMYHFFEKVLGNENADYIDVYEALDMALPGMFAYRSILNGNIPMEIPNLRNKEERDKWRNDTMCTDPAVAGDQLIPSFSKGNPEIPDAVYEKMRKAYYDDQKAEDGYHRLVYSQGVGLRDTKKQ